MVGQELPRRCFALALVLVVAGCGGDDGGRTADAGAEGDAAGAVDGGGRDGSAIDGGSSVDGATAVDASSTADAGPPVAMVTVTPMVAPMIVGTEVALAAELRDAGGNVLTGRAITWASSDPSRLSVSGTGVARALMPSGGMEVSAISEGVRGSVVISVVDGIVTGITDIHGFLARCPTNDPAYATIRADFELLADGVATVSPQCTEPYTTLPIAQLTDELYVLQALRVAYYMSVGTQGRLPWTALGFWPWLHARVAGINLKAAPGQLYCCDDIGGKLYFAMSRQADGSRDSKRDWPGLSSTVAFVAHEVRHADPGPGHVNGCPAFPGASAPLGCDPTYDLAFLGSYGLQYWLESSWANGSLYIGIPCAPTAVAQSYLADAVQQANSYIDRFVSGAPPMVTARRTYGGPCP